MSGESNAAAAPEVVALSLGPTPGDPRANLDLAEGALREAKRQRPRLRWAVLPELFTSGYSRLSRIHEHAETAAEGKSVRFFADLAGQLDLNVAYGFPEKKDDRVANSANLVGPEGLLLTYRKQKLIRQSPEPEVFVRGADMPVVDAGGVRVALAVCWDLIFPEVIRAAALAGAELVLAPSAWEDPFGGQYGFACSARALDNALYVASANQRGDYPEASFGAPGGVYRFDGTNVGNVGTLDLESMGRYRKEFGSMLEELETQGQTRLDPVE